VSDIGRNAPCPCGSGLKYKKCCLVKSAGTVAAYTAEERASALGKLARFSDRPEFKDDHMAAFRTFWGRRLMDEPDERLKEVVASEQAEASYHAWFAFDVPLAGQRTLLDLFLERQGRHLRPGGLTYLEEMRGSHLRLYEILAVKVDEGLELRDLFDDATVWVRERAATRQLVRWDLLAARIVRGGHGDWVLESDCYLFPASEREDLVRGMRKAHREFVREFPQRTLVDFFKTMAPVLHQLWLDRVALRPRPTIVTGDGEPFIFAQVTFDILERGPLKAALEAHPNIARHDDGSYGWFEKKGAFDRALGTFGFHGDRLVFETTSQGRAERGRDFIQSVAGGSVKFKAISYEDIGQAIKHAAPAKPKEDEIPPEVQAELLGKYYEDYYRKWLDQPIPALGNRTPRHAARLKTVRPKLIQLLKHFESLSERQRRRGETAYDFSWMWNELGIVRE
jgi:hypothetical protein